MDGPSIGRTKVGAVPFAVEANHASKADVAVGASGTLASQVVPAGMIGMFGGACPSGWLACDGTSGTPDLRGAYPKGGSSAFGTRVDNPTHSHALGSYAVASGGAVTPTATVSIKSDGNHSHVALMDNGGTSGAYTMVYERANTTAWTSTIGFTWSGGFNSVADAEPSTRGIQTTAVADHTHPGSTVAVSAIPAHAHTLSGMSAIASSEPTNVTVAFCMKQ